jgi:hypothetical protein
VVRLFARLTILRNLIKALIQVLPRLTAVSMLLALINYIYAVLCTELFKDMYAQGLTTHDYFGSLVLTYFTLLELMTLSWPGIARQVMEIYPWSWTISISFVFISAFIVYNLIVAVICDAVRIVERCREEKKRLEQLQDDEKADEHCSLMNPSRHSKYVSDDLWSIDSDRDRMQILPMRITRLLLSQKEALQAVEHAVLGNCKSAINVTQSWN